MSEYPQTILDSILNAKHAGSLAKANSAAKAVNFSCASSVKIELNIDAETGMIIDAGFTSNGCGYMLAAAEHVLSDLKGTELKKLKGLENEALWNRLEDKLGQIPVERKNCIDTVIAALHSALADHRRSMIEEFTGEKALVCTCFGITEDRIVELIEQQGITTAEGITVSTNAGSGCGSCLMLIDEILSSH